MTSSAVPPLTNGLRYWLRVDWVRNNGSGSQTARFYYANDGADVPTLSAWTEIGTAQSIVDVTAPNFNNGITWHIGTFGDGNSNPAAGKFLQALLYSGTYGTDEVLVADFNPQRDATTPTGTITSSTTGEVWTINGASSVVRNAVYHGTGVDGVKCFETDLSGNPLPTTTTYDAVSLNGVAGTYVSTPDSVAASITGDIDIRIKAALTDWTPAAANFLVSKRNATVGEFAFLVNAGGTLQLFWYGAGADFKGCSSSVAPTVSDGSSIWLRATRSASGLEVKFYTSPDGVTWTQLGTTQTFTAYTAADTAIQVAVGVDGDGANGPLNGRIFQAQIYNGINGTLAVDFDASRYAGGTTLPGSTGETWTLQGNAVIHPTNFPMKGYLAEAAATNKTLHSNDLSNVVWTPLGSTVSVNAGTSPDGTPTADKIVETATTANHEVLQGVAAAAGAYTVSAYLSPAGRNYGFVMIITDSATKAFCAVVDLLTGVITDTDSFGTPVSASAVVYPAANGNYRICCTATHTAGDVYIITGASDSATPTYATGRPSYAGDITKGVHCSFVQIENSTAATSYIPTTTTAVTRNADVDSVPTAGNITAAAGTIALTYTPTSAPSGTRFLWGTYVDASNYTAILHDATNLIFRKRIAGVNTDATIANAFVSGTAYKMCASWGAAGQTIYLNGTAGTPHANTASAQIAATMQIGADGNSLQQPNMNIGDVRVWNRQTSGSEQAAVTR